MDYNMCLCFLRYSDKCDVISMLGIWWAPRRINRIEWNLHTIKNVSISKFLHKHMKIWHANQENEPHKYQKIRATYELHRPVNTHCAGITLRAATIQSLLYESYHVWKHSLPHIRLLQDQVLGAGGKPSTWSPPGITRRASHNSYRVTCSPEPCEMSLGARILSLAYLNNLGSSEVTLTEKSRNDIRWRYLFFSCALCTAFRLTRPSRTMFLDV